jgi:hypothetical protein
MRCWSQMSPKRGQKQAWSIEGPMSDLPSTADIDQSEATASFVLTISRDLVQMNEAANSGGLAE